MFQKLKIGKLNFQLFQNIAQYFGIKTQFGHFLRGGGRGRFYMWLIGTGPRSENTTLLIYLRRKKLPVRRPRAYSVSQHHGGSIDTPRANTELSY